MDNRQYELNENKHSKIVVLSKISEYLRESTIQERDDPPFKRNVNRLSGKTNFSTFGQSCK